MHIMGIFYIPYWFGMHTMIGLNSDVTVNFFKHIGAERKREWKNAGHKFIFAKAKVYIQD